MHSLRSQERRIASIGTDLRSAEETKEVWESRFHQLFAIVPEYCYMISPSGQILDVNPAACSVLGYAKEELVGKPLSLIYALDCHEKMIHLLEQWKKTGTLKDEEMVIVTKRGEKRIVLLNVRSVVDREGRLLHSTSMQVDITERKRMEEKLRETQMRLTDSIASVMEVIETYERPTEPQGFRIDRSDEADRDKLRSLTKREREILHLLVCGVSTRRMAQLLGVRLPTVRNHLQNVFSKLGVHSRLEGVAFAHRVGFELRNTAS